MKIFPIILCRGGSKGVPRKNIRDLNGKPLLSYALTEALKVFPKVYLSTEDEEIAEVGKTYGANIILRPPKLAQDDSKSIDAVKHAQKTLKADYIVLLNACTPFTKAEDIQACVDIAISKKADSVVSLVEDFSSHPSKVCYLLENKIMPITSGYSFQTGERQLQTKVYKRNTAIYVISKSTIRKGLICGKNIFGYVMSKEQSWDINEPIDFEICEFLIKKMETPIL